MKDWNDCFYFCDAGNFFYSKLIRHLFEPPVTIIFCDWPVGGISAGIEWGDIFRCRWEYRTEVGKMVDAWRELKKHYWLFNIVGNACQAVFYSDFRMVATRWGIVVLATPDGSAWLVAEVWKGGDICVKAVRLGEFRTGGYCKEVVWIV